MGNLFLSSTTGPGDSLWSINPNTGGGVSLGPTGFSNVFGLDYFNGVLYGFTLAGQTISLNTSTGAGMLLFNNQINAFGADGAGGVARVPEPASLLLLGLGLAGLGVSRKRKA
ncbi:hypothetical protein BG841_13275 [Marinobacter sp. X15-166B]|nr:PEP-CTERM sorting domain-containing protein [Marinobacter sp. X15-166B]OEY67316.1 hypothetical protein BG841_13275 [Marinobacter sp. X15-166B]